MRAFGVLNADSTGNRKEPIYTKWPLKAFIGALRTLWREQIRADLSSSA